MEAPYLKRMMQLLFSAISVVSVFVFISSWLSYGFHTVRFCVTTLPVQLVTHSINRNCIFLICNGLLVFIAKSSGLTSSSSTSASSSSSSSSPHVEDEGNLPKEDDAKTEEEEDEEERQVAERTMTESISLGPVDKEIVMVHNDGDDPSLKRSFFDQVNMEKTAMIREDDEAKNEDDIKELSMDEVNNRFEVFIWKMKEEIRQEASKQQLAIFSI